MCSLPPGDGNPLRQSARQGSLRILGATQTDALNRLLASEIDAGREAVLVNLASEEYFQVGQNSLSQGRLLNIAFEGLEGGRYKIISFHAKARPRNDGPLCHHRTDSEVEQIKMFGRWLRLCR